MNTITKPARRRRWPQKLRLRLQPLCSYGENNLRACSQRAIGRVVWTDGTADPFCDFHMDVAEALFYNLIV